MARESGFLSQGKREFLLENGQGAKTSSEYSTKRGRIRSKVRAGILDFSLLLEELPASERRQVFAGEDAAHPTKPGRDVASGEYEWDIRAGVKGEGFEFIKGDEELIDATADTLTFLWLACYDAQVSPKDVFESAIEGAEVEGEAEISVVFDSDYRDSLAERAREKMARGEDLEDPEATALIKKKEEIVPNGLVFDYLRGELEQYELPPFPSE
jgi:hypothetical protein